MKIFALSAAGGGGRCTILARETEGDTTTVTRDCRAGGYFPEGKGPLTGTGGRITALVIQRRRRAP